MADRDSASPSPRAAAAQAAAAGAQQLQLGRGVGRGAGLGGLSSGQSPNASIMESGSASEASQAAVVRVEAAVAPVPAEASLHAGVSRLSTLPSSAPARPVQACSVRVLPLLLQVLAQGEAGRLRLVAISSSSHTYVPAHENRAGRQDGEKRV